MNGVFITAIHVNESRNLRDFTITLSTDDRKHLIITGRNGSGKTSLLDDINTVLGSYFGNLYQYYDQWTDFINQSTKALEEWRQRSDADLNKAKNIEVYEQNIQNLRNALAPLTPIDVVYSDRHKLHKRLKQENFLLVHFDAKRLSNLNVPKGISKVELKKKYTSNEPANKQFIQYIVNLKAERSFARDDKDNDTVAEIDQWFALFEGRLRDIFDNSNLQLVFDRKNYNFLIKEEGKIPYSLNQLSDGYSAIISIVTELILRMEAVEMRNYDLEGIVLIDEIETHLHVDLQKKILPFLVGFFPKIQFIITTHSPFVLSSLQNAVICDLETKIVTEDLTGYSYDALVESYFDSDKYSNKLKDKVYRYELLCEKDSRSIDEDKELEELRNYMVHNTTRFLSDELVVKLQEIELKNISRKLNPARSE